MTLLAVDALRAHQETTTLLHEWAPTVHRLVRERIAALDEAYGRYNHPLETRTEHAERVLAHGQRPLPLGECLFDDEPNGNNTYEQVAVGYGLPEDGPFRITFSGWYPRWAADGRSYEREIAHIDCPGWVVSEADGEQRFREQTAEMVAAVRAERERESARIDELIQEALREQGGTTNDDD